MSSNYIRVNDFAPQDGKLTFYCKNVSGSKSDGFALIENGQVYMIDAGHGEDAEMHRFLLELRAKWLANQSDDRLLEDENARLEIHWIVSHPHGDHIGAMKHIIPDRKICIMSLRAPARSYLSLDVPGALGPLTEDENNLERFAAQFADYGHTAREIIRLPHGEKSTVALPDSDTVLHLYPAPYDWSEERPSETEGFGFLRKSQPASYQGKTELGYTNGILNGNSLWVRVIKGNSVVLITGDQRPVDEMLGAMIRYYGEEEFACRILKLTHHGEKNYPPMLLKAAQPEFCIFTAAEGRATSETEELCHELGCVRYYLCDGDLFFEISDNDVTPYGISAR